MKTDDNVRLYEVTLERPITTEDLRNGIFGKTIAKRKIVHCTKKDIEKQAKLERDWTITDIRDCEKEQWLYTQRNIKWMLNH